MNSFMQKHASLIKGTISCPDRIIIKGYLPFAYPASAESFLNNNDIMFVDFKKFAKQKSEELVAAAQKYAASRNRPYEYLNHAVRKEEKAHAIAQKDGITDGLICVFSILEANQSFTLRYGKKLHLQSCMPRCQTLYFYFVDRQFGFMHVRLSTWLPYTMQVYINGHEWLERQLQAAHIGYEKVENAFVTIDNCDKAQEIADAICSVKWEKILHTFALRTNSLFKTLLSGLEYYWVIDQFEYATDIFFNDRAALKELYIKLQRHTALCIGAEDILRYLGRSLNCSFRGEVITDYKKRWPGARIKHRMKSNWIKMYDKFGVVLRVETVINDPHEFFIRRQARRKGETITGWFPMAKRITNMYRYCEIGLSANRQYIEELSIVDDPTAAYAFVEKVCSKISQTSKHCRALNPLGKNDRILFRAALRGEHFINGFRHGDFAKNLGIVLNGKNGKEYKKLSARVSRKIKLLHAHGLIAKIPRSRRYRITAKGKCIMSAAIDIHENFIPAAFKNAA